MCFGSGKRTPFVTTDVSFAFFFFIEDCSPKMDAGICLQYSGGRVAGNVEGGRCLEWVLRA